MKLTRKHKTCLETMLEIYKVSITDNPLARMGMITGCAMIKHFITDALEDKEYTLDEFIYVNHFDIVSGVESHSSFYHRIKSMIEG